MRSMRWLLAGALFLGLIAAGVTYSYFRQMASKEAFASARPAGTPVVVAIQNIPARATVTGEMVAVREMPPELVRAGAARRVDDVIGRVARETVLADEPVAEARLFPKGVKPGLSFAIPAGRRAVTVGVNEIIGVAGFVKPGDHVDILTTFKVGSAADGGEEYRSAPVVEDIPVLAAAQEAREKDGKEDARVVTSVTLAVTTEQAKRIAQAEEKGVLRLLLRPYVSPEARVASAAAASSASSAADQGKKPASLAPVSRAPAGVSPRVGAVVSVRPILPTKPAATPHAITAATAATVASGSPESAAPRPAARVAVEVIRGTERSMVTVESVDAGGNAEAKGAPVQ